MLKDMLKALRKANKVSQQLLADELGISSKTVASWEMGRTNPDYKTLSKIAEYFNVSISYLLEDGIFKQRDLVLSMRAFITHAICTTLNKEFRGDFYNYLMDLDDEKFMIGLSLAVSKIDYDDDNHKLTIRYYLDENNVVDINKNVLIEKIADDEQELLHFYRQLDTDAKSYMLIRARELAEKKNKTSLSPEKISLSETIVERTNVELCATESELNSLIDDIIVDKIADSSLINE